MTAPAWLDVMPTIPLARAVPVVVLPVHLGTVLWASRKDGMAVKVHTSGLGVVDTEAALCRVDLDDPQGFAYALRWLKDRHRGGVVVPLLDRPDLIAHYWQGTTTNADRLALAKALAEVVR